MATKQVSVRIALEGGQGVKAQLVDVGNAGSQAMNKVGEGGRRMGSQIQNASFQIADFAVQVQSGTSATRAMAQQLPQLLGGFGPIGAVASAVAAVVIGLGAAMLGGADATSKLVDELIKSGGSAGDVNSAMSGLRDVQTTYNDAINQTGDASSAAARLVLANSKTEFAARKEVLSIELELLKLRSRDDDEAITNLQGGMSRRLLEELERAKQIRDLSARSSFDGLADPRVITETNPLAVAGRVAKEFERDILALRKLTAEKRARDKALEAGTALLKTDFDALGGAGSGGASSTPGRVRPKRAPENIDFGLPDKVTGASAGQKAFNKVLAEGDRLFQSTRTSAEKLTIELKKLDDLYASGAIDQDTFQRAQAKLRDDFARTGDFAKQVSTSMQQSLGSLFDSIVFEGGKAGDVLSSLTRQLANGAFNSLAGELFGGKGGGGGILSGLFANADGNAFAGGRVVPFATGGVVDRPTLFGMRGGAGLMGEAGPEAILPLRRIGGKLGVVAQGSGGGSTVVRVELSRDLEARVITQARGETVQIVQAGINEYDRGKGRPQDPRRRD